MLEGDQSWSGRHKKVERGARQDWSSVLGIVSSPESRGATLAQKESMAAIKEICCCHLEHPVYLDALHVGRYTSDKGTRRLSKLVKFVF